MLRYFPSLPALRHRASKAHWRASEQCAARDHPVPSPQTEALGTAGQGTQAGSGTASSAALLHSAQDPCLVAVTMVMGAWTALPLQGPRLAVGPLPSRPAAQPPSRAAARPLSQRPYCWSPSRGSALQAAGGGGAQTRERGQCAWTLGGSRALLDQLPEEERGLGSGPPLAVASAAVAEQGSAAPFPLLGRSGSPVPPPSGSGSPTGPSTTQGPGQWQRAQHHPDRPAQMRYRVRGLGRPGWN
ncbi:uncharacterized protein [Vicugna pacos]|uniref:Uncharacterized protein n=1 Tax=Vicugna pacos TaxID=30538 RepID=A0ABM5D7F9_VICPA